MLTWRVKVIDLSPLIRWHPKGAKNKKEGAKTEAAEGGAEAGVAAGVEKGIAADIGAKMISAQGSMCSVPGEAQSAGATSVALRGEGR